MMVQCVMWPEGKCSPYCPTLDVMPYDGPLVKESIRKARKLTASGMKVQDIKEKLKDAGDVDAKLINKWIEEYESNEKNPMYYIIKDTINIIKQQELLAEQEKALAYGKNLLKAVTDLVEATTAVYEEAVSSGASVSVVGDESALVDHADESLPGLKRCSTLLDETSPKNGGAARVSEL
ncbi:hypothetical protein Tco_1125643 [Tanacetum coccineum]|uniref:Uncharacterized protein n=1 Tax=Tanacetum coccineum TaxID=301880 RepID=A0ABQ5JCJ0_9ASTR